MNRDKKVLTKTSRFLIALYKAKKNYGWILMPRPTMGYAINREFIDDRKFEKAIWNMSEAGWIEYEYRESKLFVKLTEKGELEALLKKMATGIRHKKWDGKWWMILFDIPERARSKRDELRRPLLLDGFKMLQASVYITPFEISDDAIIFLKKSKLIRYIRILRIDKFDNPKEFKKIFKNALKFHGREI